MAFGLEMHKKYWFFGLEMHKKLLVFGLESTYKKCLREE